MELNKNQYYWWLFKNVCSSKEKKIFDSYLIGHLQSLYKISVEAIDNFEVFKNIVEKNLVPEPEFIEKYKFFIKIYKGVTRNNIEEPEHYTTFRETFMTRCAEFEPENPGKIVDKLNEHLKNIFLNKSISLTSLNIKGVQCSYLFSLIEKLKGTTDPSEEYKINEIQWDNFEIMKEHLNTFVEHKGDFYLSDIIIKEEEENPHCVPNLKEQVIIALKGELSLYELIRSLADDIYMAGISNITVKVDGQFMNPLEILLHDLGHKTTRQEIFGSNDITKKNTIKFLDSDFFSSLITQDKYSCELWLFFITHELISASIKQEQVFLSGKIPNNDDFNDDLLDSNINNYIDTILSAFINGTFISLLPDKLYNLYLSLPYEKKIIEAEFGPSCRIWLVSTWKIFKDKWNHVITEKPKGFFSKLFTRKPKNRNFSELNKKIFKEKLEQNLQNWGKGGYRRTKNRRSKKRSNKTHKTHKTHKTRK